MQKKRLRNWKRNKFIQTLSIIATDFVFLEKLGLTGR